MAGEYLASMRYYKPCCKPKNCLDQKDLFSGIANIDIPLCKYSYSVFLLSDKYLLNVSGYCLSEPHEAKQ